MEERRFRNKITWFTFFFSVLVIWVHSYNAVLFLGNTRTAYEVDALERFLGDQVAQIAVPGFFFSYPLIFSSGILPWTAFGSNGIPGSEVCWFPISYGIFYITLGML